MTNHIVLEAFRRTSAFYGKCYFKGGDSKLQIQSSCQGIAEDCILKQAILKLSVTLNSEFICGYTCFEKIYHCGCETSASPKLGVKI